AFDLAGDAGGQSFRLRARPVRHRQPRRARAGRGRDGKTAHRSGADDENVQAGERARVPVDTGGPGDGEVDADADQAEAKPVDAGFRAGPLAGAQREAPQVAQRPAERPPVARQLQRRPDLTEDLALAHHHRLKPARHREEMLDRAVLIVHVQAGGQLVRRNARVPGKQLAHPGDPAVEAAHLGVDLNPVAGGDHERLRDVRQQRDVVQQLAERVTADRGALEDRDRRALVAQANDEDAHCCTAYASAAAWSAACPNRSALRRCAWKARICSSIDRSTLRTSTPSGTLSTSGAKFRMLVTPAVTRRSHIAWAAPAGTAITPIAMPCAATTASSSLTCLMITLPSSRPTSDWSLSRTASMRNPLVRNPP